MARNLGTSANECPPLSVWESGIGGLAVEVVV